jgi:hypothetical protein
MLSNLSLPLYVDREKALNRIMRQGYRTLGVDESKDDLAVARHQSFLLCHSNYSGSLASDGKVNVFGPMKRMAAFRTNIC